MSRESGPRRRFAVVGASVALVFASSIGLSACGVTEADSSAVSATSSRLRTVDVVEFRDLISADPAISVIDVRSPDEVAEGKIAGAVNIDFQSSDFGERIAELDKDAAYAIYCRSGNRSGQALDQMRDAGFTNVINMDGGVIDWSAAGFPLE